MEVVMTSQKGVSAVKVRMRIWNRKNSVYTIQLPGLSIEQLKLTDLELRLIQENAILDEGEHHLTTDFPMKGLKEDTFFSDYLKQLVNENLKK